jgi:hypothetical protein
MGDSVLQPEIRKENKPFSFFFSSQKNSFNIDDRNKFLSPVFLVFNIERKKNYPKEKKNISMSILLLFSLLLLYDEDSTKKKKREGERIWNFYCLRCLLER